MEKMLLSILISSQWYDLVLHIFSRKVAELGSKVNDLEEVTGLLRVLSLATSSINRLVKTHTRFTEPKFEIEFDIDPTALLRQSLFEPNRNGQNLKLLVNNLKTNPALVLDEL